MAYSTRQDIEKAISPAKVIELSDDESTGVVNDEVVDDAIRKADNLIDSYLRGSYAIPIDPSDPLVKDISIDLAIVALLRHRSPTKDAEGTIRKYTEAIDQLKGIQSGKITLTQPIEETPTTGLDSTEVSTRDHLFNNDTLDQYG